MIPAHNRTERVRLSDLRPGDTVILDGVPKTTDRHAIKHCPLMGTSLWGDVRFAEGRSVDVMLFPRWEGGELVGYSRQVEV